MSHPTGSTHLNRLIRRADENVMERSVIAPAAFVLAGVALVVSYISASPSESTQLLVAAAPALSAIAVAVAMVVYRPVRPVPWFLLAMGLGVLSIASVVQAHEWYGTTGSVCSRRGRIESMETKGGDKVIRGFVPLNDMFGYANGVRSLTQGRGSFTMQFERYEAVPFGIAEEIIKKRRAENKIR